MTEEAQQRLRVHYERMEEEELMHLRRTVGDLEDDAQGILRAEMTRRKMSWELPIEPPKKVFVPTERFTTQEMMQGGAVLAFFASDEEARFVQWGMERANMQAIFVDSSTVTDIRGPRVIVAPGDVEEAMRVMESLTDADRAEFEEESNLVPEDPVCPACESHDIYVEEDGNWRCEGCNHSWTNEEWRMPGGV